MSTYTPLISTADIATEFNPFVPPHRDNPYPVYARARKEAPVFYSPLLNLWVVTRYADIARILKDPSHFFSAHNFDPASPLHPDVLEVLSQGYPNILNLINSDSPNHEHLRGLLNPVFNEKRMATMELRIREVANELIDRFINDGQVDLVEQFTTCLPTTVMTDMLGLPSTDTKTIGRLCTSIIKLLWGDVPLEEKLASAHDIVSLQHYLAAQIHQRRATPQHGMLTDLVNARSSKGHGLEISELVNLTTLLLFATTGIVLKFLGNALMLLLSHPTQLQSLREDPNLMPNFVEESARIEPSLRAIIRTAKEDVEISGIEIPAGSRLLVVLASANHDETQFSDPDCFDIHRENLEHGHKHKHLSFGHGIHYCAGAYLGRLICRAATQTLLDRLPNLRLQPDQTLEFEPSLVYRGLQRLPVEWDLL